MKMVEQIRWQLSSDCDACSRDNTRRTPPRCSPPWCSIRWWSREHLCVGYATTCWHSSRAARSRQPIRGQLANGLDTRYELCKNIELFSKTATYDSLVSCPTTAHCHLQLSYDYVASNGKYPSRRPSTVVAPTYRGIANASPDAIRFPNPIASWNLRD